MTFSVRFWDLRWIQKCQNGASEGLPTFLPRRPDFKRSLRGNPPTSRGTSPGAAVRWSRRSAGNATPWGEAAVDILNPTDNRAHTEQGPHNPILVAWTPHSPSPAQPHHRVLELVLSLTGFINGKKRGGEVYDEKCTDNRAACFFVRFENAISPSWATGWSPNDRKPTIHKIETRTQHPERSRWFAEGRSLKQSPKTTNIRFNE